MPFLSIILSFFKNLTIFDSIAKFFNVSKFQLIAGIVIIVVLFFYWHGRNNTIKELTEQNNTLKTQVVLVKTHYENEINKLNSVIDKNNSQIDDLKKRTDTLKKKLDETAKNRAKINADTQKAVKDIMNQDNPKSCEDAIKYLADGIGELKW